MSAPVLYDRKQMTAAGFGSEATLERLEAEGMPVLDLAPRATRGEDKRQKRILRYDPVEILEWLKRRRDAV